MSLMTDLNARATEARVPISVQLDVTYRCNEQCIHCYLDHEDHGEMTFAEITALLDQLADAGVFFLTLSGGEVLLRKDFFDIVSYARSLMFCVKVKTNAVTMKPEQADRLRDLGVNQIQISVYSHRAKVHDAITKVPGSLARTVGAIKLLRSRGLQVTIANVLMKPNVGDYEGVRALAAELGVPCTIDPTITPMMDGDRKVLDLGISRAELADVFHDENLVGRVDDACAPPPNRPDEEALGDLPCSAGHSACYVSPYGDVYPCVQFPLPSGNVRTEKFIDIWRGSTALNEVRTIRLGDLPTCSTCRHVGSCTRCPGLAYMEGDMRGFSTLDCEKSFARTGVASAGMRTRPEMFKPAESAASPEAAVLGFVPLAQLKRA